jgi:hypothetical protein
MPGAWWSSWTATQGGAGPKELLARARLVPPGVVQLSRAMGFMALTPAEFRHRVTGRE